MAQSFNLANEDGDYALDSFPVPVCANIRINRCKIYRNEIYRGFSATRDDYFFGIRVHMLVTKNGEPIEFIIEPGSVSDIKVARSFKFNIPKKSKIHADKGYTDYGFEDHLEFSRQIRLLAVRKKMPSVKIEVFVKKPEKLSRLLSAQLPAFLVEQSTLLPLVALNLKSLCLFLPTL